MVIRYACLEILAQEVGDNLVLHTVGGTANEWNHLRPGPANMWCSVGSVSSVALGLSMALPHRKTVALESDGGLLLNLSVLAELGTVQPANLTLIVLDNQVYESTGGQPSATSSGVDPREANVSALKKNARPPIAARIAPSGENRTRRPPGSKRRIDAIVSASSSST